MVGGNKELAYSQIKLFDIQPPFLKNSQVPVYWVLVVTNYHKLTLTHS